MCCSAARKASTGVGWRLSGDGCKSRARKALWLPPISPATETRQEPRILLDNQVFLPKGHDYTTEFWVTQQKFARQDTRPSFQVGLSTVTRAFFKKTNRPRHQSLNTKKVYRAPSQQLPAALVN